MSAFLQSLSVRFAGRPPGRPSRNGHPFYRGQLMPKEKPRGVRGAESPETAGDRMGVGRATLKRCAAPSRVSTVAAPVGCLQPTGLA